MLVVNHGMKPFHAVLISLLNLTSAGQFAGLNVILAGSSGGNGTNPACH